MTQEQQITALAVVVRDKINDLASGARKPLISQRLDDGALGKTYSQIAADIAQAISDAITALINGATTNGNTLKKLEDLITSITGGNLASQAYVDNAIQALIGAAPASLDTLKELADQLQADETGVAAIVTQLAAKADAANVYDKTTADTTFVKVVDFNNLIGDPAHDFVVDFTTGLLP
jgi:hypothetical protein